MVRVGVSQCPTGGWRKRQGTEYSVVHSAPNVASVVYTMYSISCCSAVKCISSYVRYPMVPIYSTVNIYNNTRYSDLVFTVVSLQKISRSLPNINHSHSLLSLPNIILKWLWVPWKTGKEIWGLIQGPDLQLLTIVNIPSGIEIECNLFHMPSCEECMLWTTRCAGVIRFPIYSVVPSYNECTVYYVFHGAQGLVSVHCIDHSTRK